MWRWPSTIPGNVSTSTSFIEARWISAKLRICCCANLMSSIVCGETFAIKPRISSSERRKLGGDHLSKRSDKSRTAASPRAFTSAMIASTALLVFASASSCCPARAAVLMWRGMNSLLLDDLVGAREKCRRDGEAERLCRFEIQHQLELCRLLDGQISRLCTLQDFIDIRRAAPEQVGPARPVGQQATRLHEFRQLKYRR